MAKIGTDRDLAYWLQGFFEIGGSSDLPAETLKKVAKRINEMPVHGELAKFIMGTVFDNGFEGQGPAIAKKLSEMFVHEIDPTIEGDQKELRSIHEGKIPPKLEAMC